MLDFHLHQDELFEALLASDPTYDGKAFVGVKTTGIFCRLTCPARKPKRENAAFYRTPAECMEAGFRPCKRCRPLIAGGGEPIVSELMAAIEQDPGRRWSETDIKARGLDPSTVRRAFKRQLGATFLEMARLARLRVAASSRKSGSPVIEAQLEAGFESASGFRSAFAALLGKAPGSMPTDAPLAADFIETPLGAMVAVADEARVWLLEFADRKELARELAAVEGDAKGPIGFGTTPALEQVRAELEQYFEGRSSSFQAQIAPYGTSFTRSVHAELRRIPVGDTRSYGELAKALGRPTAMRAVARANAANRLAVIVPCHRVIAADGGIAGYAGGVWRKRWLLDHEAAHFG